MRINEIAAAIHHDMVTDPANGYSWSPRWGEDGKGVKKLTIDGKTYQYDRGSYDCSSSVVTAWNEALRYTKYKDALKGATYTGNMLSVFLGSGLFVKWNTASTIAQTGDVYLNYANHTAMCQTPEPDMLSEFRINENGEVYGGKVGDQTGSESWVRGYYEYPWNCTLHYNGKADEEERPASKTARLFGIDVSSNQPENVCSKVACDFAIVKMSGNPQGYSWNYVNPYAKRQCADAVKKGALLGLYHFTWGKQADVEAEFFVKQVKELGYLGKAMLVIDYEAEATERGSTWLKKFAKRVEELAGYKPVIYASGSVIVGQSLFSLGYPIWCANYPMGYDRIDGYKPRGSVYKGCEKAVMWQFTSQGYLSGYAGALDLNVFYGSASDFKALMGPNAAGAKPTTKPKAQKLVVDGSFGPLTKKELQRQLGIKQTGKFDKATKKALQRKLKVAVDGVWGPKSKAAYRRKLGIAEDASGKAACRALQKALNAGKVAKW